MDEATVLRMIRRVVREELAQICMGTVTDTKDQLRASAQRFDDEPPKNNLRQIRPFGLASRAPDGTQCVMAPIASDPTHINILGEFDVQRPSIEKGESILYGADGQVVYMKNGGTIHQGVKTAANPVVLGDILQDQIRNWIQLFLEADQIGFDSLGLPVYLDPLIREGLEENQENYVDDPTTNIVGQKNFVDRGV